MHGALFGASLHAVRAAWACGMAVALPLSVPFQRRCDFIPLPLLFVSSPAEQNANSFITVFLVHIHPSCITSLLASLDLLTYLFRLPAGKFEIFLYHGTSICSKGRIPSHLRAAL